MAGKGKIIDYYWEIILKDGSRFEVSPQAVPTVNKRMSAREPINFKTATVLYADIEKFQQTDKPYGQPLLEAAAQAFKEPMLNPDGSMVVNWVKKSISQRAWDKSYSGIPAYRRIGDTEGRVTIAFRVPVHEVNTETTTPCSDEEIATLTRQ